MEETFPLSGHIYLISSRELGSFKLYIIVRKSSVQAMNFDLCPPSDTFGTSASTRVSPCGIGYRDLACSLRVNPTLGSKFSIPNVGFPLLILHVTTNPTSYQHGYLQLVECLGPTGIVWLI